MVSLLFKSGISSTRQQRRVSSRQSAASTSSPMSHRSRSNSFDEATGRVGRCTPMASALVDDPDRCGFLRAVRDGLQNHVSADNGFCSPGSRRSLLQHSADAGRTVTATQLSDLRAGKIYFTIGRIGSSVLPTAADVATLLGV